MVFVGKAAARPAKYRNLEVFESLEYIGAITIGVGNCGTGTYPETAIDACAKVLGKLTVYLLVDFVLPLRGMNGD